MCVGDQWEKGSQSFERLNPRRAVLTHMHTPLDYATVQAETPPHIEPAYDGMTVELPF